MANAPVCHLPSPTVATTPDPKQLPSIPIATPNLAALTATVNAMRQVIMIYTGQMGPQGRPGVQGAQGKAAPSGSWTQADVQTKKVRVFQNNDPTSSNFVDVEYVSGVTFNNNATKQTIRYQAPAQNTDGGG